MNLTESLATLRPLIFFFLIILPLLAALFCLYLSFRYLKASWILKDNPRSKIRSAAQGYVELTGKAEPLDTLMLSKLKTLPCLWNQYSVEIQKKFPKEQQEETVWELLEEGKSRDPFLLQDETGSCVVLSEHAVILTGHSESWVSHETFPPLPKKPSSFWNFVDKLLFGNPNALYRYREQRLEKGDTLYATGTFFTLTAQDPLILNSPLLSHYMQTHQLSHINILWGENLPPQHEFVISSFEGNALIKSYRRNALMYFLAALFFFGATMSTVYRIAMKSL